MRGFDNGIGVQRSGDYTSVLARLINNDDYNPVTAGGVVLGTPVSSTDGSDGLSDVPQLFTP